MGFLAGHTFVNLTVKDLVKSTRFYERIGFRFLKQFTDDKAACMIVNENTYILLIVDHFSQVYKSQTQNDSMKSYDVTVSLAADSREKVDDLVNLAMEAGAMPLPEPIDLGLSYFWGFKDLDGNLWEVAHIQENILH
ncbi:MAG TPA: VOC family protein [Bacillales bacterium]|nr:VOC family protein [Bacillales bacterium]